MKRVILLTLLSSISLALFENSYVIKHVNKIQDFNQILESDFVSMVYFYAEDCENC